MTEREKMLAGQLYDCGDAELLAQWHKAKDLARDYNQTDSADACKKEAILNELLGGKGKNLSNKNQEHLASSESSKPTTESPGYPKNPTSKTRI